MDGMVKGEESSVRSLYWGLCTTSGKQPLAGWRRKGGDGARDQQHAFSLPSLHATRQPFRDPSGALQAGVGARVKAAYDVLAAHAGYETTADADSLLRHSGANSKLQFTGCWYPQVSSHQHAGVKQAALVRGAHVARSANAPAWKHGRKKRCLSPAPRDSSPEFQ